MPRTRSRTPGGARARAKLEKGERIRAAAERLFAAKGYEQTTTKQVAVAAGVATGTLFLYARDKPDLLCMVMHDLLREAIDRRLATLPRQAPLLEQLLHMFRGIFAMYGERPAMATAFVATFPSMDGPNGQRVNGLTFAFLLQLAMLVRDAQARGEVAKEVEPLLAAQNLFALYLGALMAWLSRLVSLEAALEPGLRGALALQIRGFRP